jgi:hypothetical protein
MTRHAAVRPVVLAPGSEPPRGPIWLAFAGVVVGRAGGAIPTVSDSDPMSLRIYNTLTRALEHFLRSNPATCACTSAA